MIEMYYGKPKYTIRIRKLAIRMISAYLMSAQHFTARSSSVLFVFHCFFFSSNNASIWNIGADSYWFDITHIRTRPLTFDFHDVNLSCYLTLSLSFSSFIFSILIYLISIRMTIIVWILLSDDVEHIRVHDVLCQGSS